ncbi:MAG: transglycosylase domain-containing protein [Bacteroidales bacterium]
MTISPFKRKFLILFWGTLFGSIVIVALLFSMIANGKIGYMPPIEELENPKNKFASVIYSSDMEELGRYYQSKENRVYVPYNELSPNLVNALIATEDVRFTSHSGIDAMALLRAIVKRGLLMQKSGGGGSTITQQLAKLLYSPEAENLLERALQKPIEWVIAVQLERFYTKEEILNMYLNKFDFLNNAVGIQSAAKVYFDKNPSELTIEEAATLVGMCKNPSYFNPVRFNERTLGRRNVVIDQMEKYDFISEEQADTLKATPLKLKFSRVDHKEGLAPYFREYLRLAMIATKPDRKKYRSWMYQKYVDDSTAWENNPLYGWCNKNTKADGTPYNLYTDGLKIYATIDSRMQQYAEEAVQEHIFGFLQPKFYAEKKNRSYAPFSKDVSSEEVKSILNRAMRDSDRYKLLDKEGLSNSEIEKVFNTPVEMQVFTLNGIRDTILSPIDSIRHYKYFLRAGFMAMDPHTGHVRAFVGGPNFRYFQYDMVTQGRRQVGSTIKPFLYTLAMSEGFKPTDRTLNVEQRVVTETGQIWSPRNVSTARIGESVTLEWGLANSNNWISAYLMKNLSPYAFVRLLRSFGMRGQIDPVVSLALGSCEVSLEEMVSAYSSFANRGIRVSPLYVTRIEDNHGNVVANFTPEMNEVFNEETADKMLNMLRGVIDGGTGSRIRFRYGFKGEIGGKTGTTQNNSDGWFMGFVPNLVAGAWVGGEDRSIHFDYTADGQGASMSLPVWAIFMKKVLANPELGISESDRFKYGTTYSDIPVNTVFREAEGIDAIFE